MGFVDAHSNCALCRCESSVDQMVCFIFIAWVGRSKGCFDHIVDSFKNGIELGALSSAGNAFDALADEEAFKINVATF